MLRRPRSFQGLAVAVLFSSASILSSAASAITPVVDGTFTDWADEPLAEDGRGDGGRFDILALWVRSDSERVFLRFDLDREINLQSTSGLVLSLCDSDDRTLLAWDFGARTGTAAVGRSERSIGQWEIAYRQAPTVTSSRFEISLRRRTDDGAVVVPGPDVFAVLHDSHADGDRLPDAGGVEVTLSDAPPPPALKIDLARRDADDIRVLTWNVRFDGLFKNPAPFLRVLRAIDPDVICFQEVWTHTARQAADQVSLAIPASQWYGAHTTDGLIVSRYPFLDAAPIDDAGNYWSFIDLPDARYDVDLSVVSAHPPCCEQEARRQEQLDAIAAWLRELASPGGREVPFGTPTVVAGDMNLVGGSVQLRTLLEGLIVNEETFGPTRPPDWDGTALRDADPRHAGGRDNYTWRGPDGVFAPGKLDYIVYTDSVLEQGNAFVLATESLSEETLLRHGLRRSDTEEASDHLPVVVDLIPTGGPPPAAPDE
jgi:endonuclease/exonuclease/phosphatase family metal-dependent hydrolase